MINEVRTAHEHYLRTFSETMAALETAGRDVTGAHYYVLTKHCLRVGWVRTEAALPQDGVAASVPAVHGHRPKRCLGARTSACYRDCRATPGHREPAVVAVVLMTRRRCSRRLRKLRRDERIHLL